MQIDIIRARLACENGSTVLAKLERIVLIEVLAKFHGNQTQSAKYMRMNRGTFRTRMKQHGIESIYK